MLTLAYLHFPQQKREYLQNYLNASNSSAATWVVSDLRNKFEIQQFILQKQDSFEDLSVLRASELWRFLLKRAHPEIKLVSRDFVRVWVREQLRKEEKPQSSRTDQVVLDMMDLMSGVFCHPDGGSMMRRWFQENPESLQRWGGWFLLAEEYFSRLLSAKRISLSWISALLQGVDGAKDWSAFWLRPLIFDLGSQLSQAEAEIIRDLSRSADVLVLAPSKENQIGYEYLLKPYSDLEAQSQTQASKPSEDDRQNHQGKFPLGQIQVHRLSGVLAESKMACQIIRGWIDAQIPAEQIAVIAPDMEMYWPLLQPLLNAEGISVNKEKALRLQNLPSVSQWIAELRLRSRDVRFADLEKASFSLGQKSPALRFEEFEALFSELIDEQDLHRHQNIQKAFQSSLSASDEISLDQFLGYAVRFWNKDEEFLPLEITLRELLTSSDFFETLKVSSWIQFLEQIIAQKEIRISKATLAGIHLTNLSSADSLKITHRYFLGLSESQLRTKTQRLLSPLEISSISQQLGFQLEHPEISSMEFDLQWLGKNHQTCSIYSFPQTGFSGAAEAPSSFWVQRAGIFSPEKAIAISTPDQTRWDDMIRHGPQEILVQEYQWATDQAELADRQLKADLGEQPTSALQLNKEIPLSASSLESFRECPFIFASQKLFRLMDLPILDLDVDRRTRGLLAHGVLEKLGMEPRRFDWSSEDLRQMIDSMRDSLGLGRMDDFIWRSLREKQVTVALRFLSFEKEWKHRFPETQILAVEKSFEFRWNMSGAGAEAGPGSKIRGKIDRIDQDQSGRMVVVDYKVSPGDFKSFASWIDKNQIQLALYMIALEEGLVADIPAGEVVGALYYILKTMNRDHGLKSEDGAGTLFELDRKKNRISAEGKTKLLKEIRELIGQVIDQIQNGIIEPDPLNPDTCQSCHWRNLCRAPHLN